MTEKKYLSEVFCKDLCSIFTDIPEYRSRQIAEWIYKKNELSPDSMTNIPVDLRQRLAGNFITDYPKLLKKEKTSDNTEKFLVELYDGECIEFVIIDSIQRKTLCISSQVGCPIQCRFCASGRYGLKRNLLPGEIIGQFILTAKYLGRHPDNVVFMGIGEPLLNFDNLVTSLEIICSDEYINYARRRITISTSGIPKLIFRLADLKTQWNLAVSIHAPDDATRAKLIPEKSIYPLKEIIKAAKYYFEKTTRLITLEYTLIEGINDSPGQASELADIAAELRAKVNLIPYNETGNPEFIRPSPARCMEFAETLKKKKINVLLRLEKGVKINAACGQLRASKINSN